MLCHIFCNVVFEDPLRRSLQKRKTAIEYSTWFRGQAAAAAAAGRGRRAAGAGRRPGRVSGAGPQRRSAAGRTRGTGAGRTRGAAEPPPPPSLRQIHPDTKLGVLHP